MLYTNFDQHITEVYGIVIHNWPINVFRPPGEISSPIALHTLIDSWSTGATEFRRLNAEELAEWRVNRRQHAISATSTSSPETAAATAPSSDGDDQSTPAPTSSPTSSPLPSPEDPASDPQPSQTAVPDPTPMTNADPERLARMPARNRARAEGVFVAMDVVTGPDGRRMAVTKRPRQERSDKGGKRQKKAATTTNDATTAGDGGAAKKARQPRPQKKGSTRRQADQNTPPTPAGVTSTPTASASSSS